MTQLKTQITLMDVATSVILAVKRALADRYEFRLKEFPEITREPFVIFRVAAPAKDVAALLEVEHKGSIGKGFVALIVHTPFLGRLIESMGESAPADDQRVEASRVFFETVLSKLKEELSRSFEGAPTLGDLRLFSDGAYEEISGVKADEKFILRFKKDSVHLMEVHLAFQALK